MISRRMRFITAAMVLMSALAVATPAKAWRGPGVFIGVSPFFFGPRVFYPPPIYYPPPAYYPQPAYYPPTFYARPGTYVAQSCNAGPYVCPLSPPGPIGAPCSCPTDRGRIAGRVN